MKNSGSYLFSCPSDLTLGPAVSYTIRTDEASFDTILQVRNSKRCKEHITQFSVCSPKLNPLNLARTGTSLSKILLPSASLIF